MSLPRPEDAPRLDLARLPTPVHPLPRLSAAVGAELWVKRDDLTGLGLSGNKVRKLELLLAEALARGATTVLTTGGIQSNHCRATAVAARQLGLRPVLLLRGEPPVAPDGNLLLDQLLGAELRWCDAAAYRDRRDDLLQELAAEAAARGEVPYVIPEGGSNGLGAVGYALAAAELAAQEPRGFDVIAVAVGSGGTLAGLAAGPSPGPVRGFAVCDDRDTFTRRAAAIADDGARLGLSRLPAPGAAWDVLDAYRGEAYGVASPEVWDTIARVARLEGLLLDPVYTGKAMHGLLCELAAGRAGRRALFWHTGGVYGLFGRGAEVPGA